MRIKDKCQFALGVFDILISIIGLILAIVLRRTESIVLLLICFLCGVISILNGIETKAQRQKYKEKLQAMAKLYGWNKDGQMCETCRYYDSKTYWCSQSNDTTYSPNCSSYQVKEG